MLVVVTFYSTLYRMVQSNVIKKKNNRYEHEKKKYNYPYSHKI